MIVGGLLVVTIALVALDSYEWRRASSTVA